MPRATPQFESFVGSLITQEDGERLLLAACSGDAGALRVLIERFEGFTEAVSFLAYVNSWLPHTATRHTHRLRRFDDREGLSLDDPLSRFGGNLLTSYDGSEDAYLTALTLPREVFSRFDLAVAAEGMPEWQWTCLSLTIVDGFTERDVGLTYGVSQQAVHKAKMKAITALRKAASEGGTGSC